MLERCLRFAFRFAVTYAPLGPVTASLHAKPVSVPSVPRGSRQQFASLSVANCAPAASGAVGHATASPNRGMVTLMPTKGAPLSPVCACRTRGRLALLGCRGTLAQASHELQFQAANDQPDAPRVLEAAVPKVVAAEFQHSLRSSCLPRAQRAPDTAPHTCSTGHVRHGKGHRITGLHSVTPSPTSLLPVS
jgi:hypothetical protein